MAVSGPRARALAVEVADTVTLAAMPGDGRESMAATARGILAGRDVELAQHVPVVGDLVAPFMASARDTDIAALRAEDSLLVLPADPAAAVEELRRRREEIGYSYVVVGSHAVDVMAPVVAELAGR
ncbi:hypothetical protein [Phycicoccus sp. HDW14]|uniref:hypothetical protein n=1 Tax=Phycicoccus sp. HDW14 TaxID=2714941 RepID=UPI001F0F2E97|nr:hypothetical protein [Phycicoccus sp. HDW14]